MKLRSKFKIAQPIGTWAFQVALVGKNPPANAGDTEDTNVIPGLGRSPGEGHGNPLQHSSLENPMDKGAWQAIVHRVTKSQTQIEQLSMQACIGTHSVTSLKLTVTISFF